MEKDCWYGSSTKSIQYPVLCLGPTGPELSLINSENELTFLLEFNLAYFRAF